MTYRILSTDFFERTLRHLSRKYRKIRDDFQDLIDELEADPYSGDRIPKCVGPIFKIRMASRDMQKGKSGGYRVIYLIQETEKTIYLLTLYPKGTKENIDVAEINQILIKTGLHR